MWTSNPILKEGALPVMFYTERRLTNEARLFDWRYVKGRDFTNRSIAVKGKVSFRYLKGVLECTSDVLKEFKGLTQ